MEDNSSERASCYVPDPVYTFLFPPKDAQLFCIICHDSELFLPWAGHCINDNDPALLPCGHVFGSECLDVWLETQDTCPVCRFKLEYELCQHPIRPRWLTRENVLFVPPTLPEGGTVATQCGPCKRETEQRVASELCMDLAEKYCERKARYEQTGWETDRKKMVKAREDLERLTEVLTRSEDLQW